MNLRLASLLLLSLALPTALLADGFSATARKIEQVIQRHMVRPPATPRPPNPFLAIAAPPPSAVDPSLGSRNEAPLSDDAALAAFISGLRISGVAEYQGRPHLVINSMLYSTGSLVPVRTTPPVHIQLLRLSSSEVTFSYGTATKTVGLGTPRP